MPVIMLVPMSTDDLDAFVDEEVVDYAEEHVCEGTWSGRDVLSLPE